LRTRDVGLGLRAWIVNDADLLDPEMVVCHECGAEVTAVDAATHAYVPAVMGCWAAVTQMRAV